MKFTDALRDRAAARIVLDPGDARYVTGSDEDQAKARAEWHRARFTHEVLSSKLEEIPRSRLQPVRGMRGMLEDTDSRDGDYYVVHRGTSVDLTFAENLVAYYFDPAGVPVLLERPNGIRSRAELEKRKAERAERRNAPKPPRRGKRR